jgi:hypothetical protein
VRLLTTTPSDQQQPIPTKLCMSFDRLAVNCKFIINLVSHWRLFACQLSMATILEAPYCMILWECFVNFCLLHSKTEKGYNSVCLLAANCQLWCLQLILHLTMGLLLPFGYGHNIWYAIVMTTCKDIVNIPMTLSYSWLYLGDWLWFPADTCRNTNKWEWNPEH